MVIWGGGYASVGGSGSVSTGSITDVSNIGTGEGLVFKELSGSVVQLKTLKAGTNIVLNNDSNEITVNTSSSIRLGDSFSTTANYTGNTSLALFQGNKGTVAAPISSQDAVVIYQKIASNGDVIGVNPTLYTSIKKRASGSLARATAGFFEAQDDVGGNTSFVEGIRSQGILMSHAGGSGEGFGIVTVAGTDTSINYRYLIGIEADIFNNSGTPAGPFYDKDKHAIGFLASSHGSQNVDAGFATNAYTTRTFREGFLVAENSVTDAAFRSRANTAYGLDLAQGGTQSSASVRIPNDVYIVGRNFTNTADVELIKVSSGNNVRIGGNQVAGLDPINVLINNSTFFLSRQSEDVNCSEFYSRKARGIESSPAAVQQFDILLNIGARGYFSGGTPSYSGNRGAIKVNASENFTNTSQGTYITFSTTSNGSTSLTDRLSILNNGILYFYTLPPAYADNAAAKAGGLTDGMVYRTSTGQLMIVYT